MMRAARTFGERRRGGGSGARAMAVPAKRRRGAPSRVALAAILGFALVPGCETPPPVDTSRAPDGDLPDPVVMPPPVRRPEPGEPMDTYSVSVEDVPVDELLFALARDAGLGIYIDPEIDGRVTMNAVDEPLPDLLERISRHARVRFDLDHGSLIVHRDEPVLRTYPIDYVHVARDTTTVNEVGTSLGSGIESSSAEENGSGARLTATTEHRFWDGLLDFVATVVGESPDGSSNVFAHRESSLLAVRAPAARHREIESLLARVLTNARRQVLIEAAIVEVDLDDRFRGGVDFTQVLGDLRLETRHLGGNLGVPPFAGVAIGTRDGAGTDFGLTVRLLDEFGDVRVLSTPLVMALNNQTAVVKVVENRVFFTSEVQTTTRENSDERNVRTTLHTVPVGLILLVTPTVGADGEVILKIRPTVTREVGFTVDPNPDLAEAGVVSRIPELSVRELESVLRLRSGEVAVLGGLMREEERDDIAGVPWLSRLPRIGAAFRYQDRGTVKTELIVLLRPTFVRDPSINADLKRFRRWWPRGRGSGAALPASRVARPSQTQSRSDPGSLAASIRRSRRHPPEVARLQAAHAALARGDHENARSAYRDALELRPVEALGGLGALAVRTGRLGEARAWYRQLLAVDPGNEDARAMSIVLDWSLGPEEFEREVRRSLPAGSDSAYLKVGLGNAFAREDRWEAAMEAYRAAQRLAPASPDSIFNLAVCAEHLGRHAEALAHYREALDLALLFPAGFGERTVRERIASLAAAGKTAQ